ncbi:MAG: hypothetical protein K6C95_10960 [Lachnospiraceae bacterium]|nr:hypothetical protein [Lachnospiraceae bacterium]
MKRPVRKRTKRASARQRRMPGQARAVRRAPRRPREEATEENWAEVVYSREDMDMDDPAERREFVNACLTQIAEARAEMDELEYEYRTVTAYLHDLEEIDALPDKHRADVAALAQKIIDASIGRKEFYNREVSMSESDFERMHELGPKTKEIIKTMSDAEDQSRKIKNDLRRLDNERNAYEYRLDELDRRISAGFFLTIFTTVLLIVFLVLLFVLGKMLSIDVRPGYLLAILFAAVAAVLITTRSQNAAKEKKIAGSGISRLIMLQNTVKIRYVNNRNLINYMVLKYHVKSSEELQHMYELYEKEKEDRAKLRGSEKVMMESQRDLLAMLRNFRLQYPEVWMRKLPALADTGEEVEVRHELIGRRQALRERMEYNEHKVRGRAKDEIERLARDYPQYADEILDMVRDI